MDTTNSNSSVILDADQPQHQTLDAFFKGEPTGIVAPPSKGLMPVVHDESAMSSFLSRPLLLTTFTWSVGSSPYLTLDPWTTFLTSTAVKQRISNYARLRADMVLKVVINGSPMHYGCARFCYRPHPMTTTTGDPVFNHAIATEAAGAATNLKIVASQLPGFYINPCYDATNELRIPYMSPVPGFELNKKALSYGNMGTVYLIGFAPLAHANAGTNAVTIEVYGHMENITIDVPTAEFQGYTMEEAAHIIKRFLAGTAKATAIAHEWTPKVMSAMALAGFSRPRDPEIPANVRVVPFQLANYDLPDSSEALSLSASAELTLGGQELGTNGEDELSLASVATRPGFIASQQWSSTMTRGTFLVGSIVSPVQSNISAYQKVGAGYSQVYHTCPTPCCFAAMTCKMWRGTMVYKFSVVSSPYHKGRVRIYYECDPSTYTDIGGNPAMNLINSVVIDLSESKEATVEVPWQNVRDMCKVWGVWSGGQYKGLTQTSSTEFASVISLVNTTNCNGYIVCEVLSPLTGLTGDASVYILCEVSCKDMVLYQPSLQAGYTSTGRAGLSALSMDGAAIPYVPQSYDVTGGDAIATLRQLVKRYTEEYSCTVYNSSPSVTSASSSVLGSWLCGVTLPAWLPPPGFPPAAGAAYALDLATNATSDPVNYTSMSYHIYLSLAFAMARGGIRWKVAYSSRGADVRTVLAPVSATLALDEIPARSDARFVIQSSPNGSSLLVSQTSASYRQRNTALVRRGGRGMQLAPIDTPAMGGSTGVLDFEVPYQSYLRAHNPRLFMGTGVEARESLGIELVADLPVAFAATAGSASHTVPSSIVYDIYTAAGEDFNLFGFIHAPAFLSAMPTRA